MRKLLFFSRVTLICNVCFLITFLMHYIPELQHGIVPSTIIILGNVLALIINLVVNIFYMVRLIIRKPLFAQIPAWLVATNFVFFIFQNILLIK